MQKRFTDAIVIKIALLVCLLAGSAHANVKGTINQTSGWYSAGSTLTVTATPIDQYRYVEWQGDTIGATFESSQISFTVDGARRVDAVFKDIVTENGQVPWWWLADLNPAWATNEFEAVVSTSLNNGVSTIFEAYWTGTDPENENSPFEIARVVAVSGVLRLQWSHARVDPDLPPIVIEGRVSMTAGDWQYVDEVQAQDIGIDWPIPAEGDNRFFRLRVVTP